MKKIFWIIMGLSVFSLMTFGVFAQENKAANNEHLEKAVFAGGCFWCMETPFEKITGVKEVISGFTGGGTEDPTYREVSSGRTGHCEAVEVIYDPQRVSYSKLLNIFWHNIDPTDPGGQFNDRGNQYRTEIFYFSEEQKQLAERSKKKLEKSGVFKKTIVTNITPAATFYPAEDYHQDYYKKNPIQYKFYRFNSGRDQFLDGIWGKKREH